MLDIIRNVGTVKPEQLRRFFSDAEDAHYIEHYLNNFISERKIDYNKIKDEVSWHNGAKLTAVQAKNYMKAFWVIVPFRSGYIRDILPMKGVTQFIFITTDNSVYDVANIFSIQEAQYAYIEREKTLFHDMEDEVNHIAIVDSAELGDQLAAYNFDSYCILDKNYKPQYTPLS